MESRNFIKVAAELIVDITTFSNAHLSHEEEILQGNSLQKRLDAALTGLVNPTLPSAAKLVAVATNAGFGVSSLVRQRVADGERCW